MYFARVQHLPRRHIDRVGSVFCARAGENVFGTGEPSNRRLGNVPPGRRGQVDTQRGRSIVHAHLCWRCCNAHTCAPLGANTFLSSASPFLPSTPSHKHNRKSAYIVLYMPLKKLARPCLFINAPPPGKLALLLNLLYISIYVPKSHSTKQALKIFFLFFHKIDRKTRIYNYIFDIS